MRNHEDRSEVPLGNLDTSEFNLIGLCRMIRQGGEGVIFLSSQMNSEINVISSSHCMRDILCLVGSNRDYGMIHSWILAMT